MLVSGCSSDVMSYINEPTATPQPTPTPTPLPRADSVVQAYLSAWTNGDYATMYNLLTPAWQEKLSLEQFQKYYQQAQNQATVQQVEAQVQSMLQDKGQAAANFHSVWQTYRFGQIYADNQMHLKYAGQRWGVEWQPTLVLPQLGDNVTLAFLSEQPTRGNIYDKNFHAVAAQGQVVTVGIVPQYIVDEQKTVANVAQITGVSPEKIRADIASARPDWFVPIADVSFETSLEFDELFNSMPGTDRRARTVRTYNDGDIAAHIIGYMGSIPAESKDKYVALGYTGDEMVGLAGVEAWAETQLAGQRGGRLATISPPPGNQVLSELATVTSQAGSSVYLTVDLAFQAAIEGLLGQRKGAIVVMKPDTGQIYALATYPRFNPSVFTQGVDANAWAALYSDENRPLISRATQGAYPAGSIFKVVSLTAALESLGMDPATPFTCTGKWHGLGEEFTKECWLKTGHGTISLLDGLTQSCNVVFYEVGLALHRTNPDLLPQWARAYGLGARSGIVGINEESTGVVPDNAWKQANLNQPLFDGDAVNSAIGQGYVLVTPLQIAQIMAAIANGGTIMRPHVIDRIVAVDGTEDVIQPEVVSKLPVSPENLALIKSSLKAITSEAGGTARHIFEGINYTAAGKTGTAESGQEEPHAWFAGYAPTDTPRVAVSVILENAGEGSKQAAPLFRQVVETFFDWEASQA